MLSESEGAQTLQTDFLIVQWCLNSLLIVKAGTFIPPHGQIFVDLLGLS